MKVSKVRFLKQDGCGVTHEESAVLETSVYHDAAFMRVLTHALSPYQVVTTDDMAETVTVTLAHSVALGNRSPVDNNTIVALIEGKQQLADVFSSDRLI